MGPFAKEETSEEKGVDTAGIEVGMCVHAVYWYPFAYVDPFGGF